MVRLYDLILPARVYAQFYDGSNYIDVHHLDGYYSFGRTEKGIVAHLCAICPLVAVAHGEWRVVDG